MVVIELCNYIKFVLFLLFVIDKKSGRDTIWGWGLFVGLDCRAALGSGRDFDVNRVRWWNAEIPACGINVGMDM